jgi:hypothetical protein
MAQNDRELDEAKKQLLSEIEKRAAFDNKWRERNYHFAQLTIWASVMASLASSIAVAVGKLPAWFVAILAAIPAFMAVINGKFLFYQRSRWHGAEFLNLQELAHKLRFQGASAADVSAEYCKLRRESEPHYPGFGDEVVSKIPKKKA